MAIFSSLCLSFSLTVASSAGGMAQRCLRQYVNYYVYGLRADSNIFQPKKKIADIYIYIYMSVYLCICLFVFIARQTDRWPCAMGKVKAVKFSPFTSNWSRRIVVCVFVVCIASSAMHWPSANLLLSNSHCCTHIHTHTLVLPNPHKPLSWSLG